LITKTLKWESDPPITVHGFRSTLTDWCHAQGFAPRLVQRQLDHVVGGKVEQAYGHDPMIEERRAMMQLWGDYCAGPEPEPMTGTVLHMNRRRKGRKAS
jgi:integrase